MKTTTFVPVTLLLILVLSCKKSNHQEATVVKDCSGTYLKIGGKEHQVCNAEYLSPFEDGDKVAVDYKSLEGCDNLRPIPAICNLYHPHEGWIEVLKVK